MTYEPGQGSNLIHGANGSGKTTVLEALHLVAFGKSFLANRSADLVRTGAEALRIQAIAEAILGYGSASIELRKSRGDTEISFDGQPVVSSSALARHLPVLVMNSRAPDLLSDNPASRRALLDRSLFHVKHSYIDLWKQYRNALRQRNVLLQRTSLADDETRFWEEKLAEFSNAIDYQRSALVSFINRQLEVYQVPGLEGRSFNFEYNPGWDRARELLEQFEDDRVRDAGLGYTVAGPHRADLTLQMDGRSASRRLSRGQLKIIVCLVITAIARYVQQASDALPVLLIDDLAAEMDDRMLQHAVQAILNVETQSFFTAIKPSDLRPLLPDDTFVFHVERSIH